MRSLVLLLILAATSINLATADHWALIIAGSNTYYNYRHQADVLHAACILRDHGIPSERIITMMYDDIAYNPANPTPGIVINAINGTNVYPCATHDYTHHQVNLTNFQGIMLGDGTVTGQRKVFETGPEDDIFIYFADHGGPGVFCFPYQNLYADDLNNLIIQMYENRRFRSMVIYMEACESGSMFNGYLRPNISVYAVTAANPDESSWGCCYDSYRQAYLGDVFSINWMWNSDRIAMRNTTIQEEFQKVRAMTNTSTVCEYGNLNVSNRLVQAFQGRQYNRTKALSKQDSSNSHISDVVPSHRIGLLDQIHKLENQMKKGYPDIDDVLLSEAWNQLTEHMDHFLMLREKYNARRPLNMHPVNQGCNSDTRVDLDCVRGLLSGYTYGLHRDIVLEYLSSDKTICRI